MSGRVMIAAIKSGSGKTICTMGLIAALKNRGIDVASVKSGPDYIDPMFHRVVLGTESANLDTFFTDRDKICELYDDSHEITVIEGVMGLYDGLGGIKEEGSAYDLARGLKCPIILVVDGKGMGKTIVPVISGMLAFDTDRLIKGVIINRVSEGFYATLKKIIEDSLGINVLGYIKDDKAYNIESRHLGLVTPDVVADIREKIDNLSNLIEKSVDIYSIIDLARHAEKLDSKKAKGKHVITKEPKVRLAIARDEAFCFYYSENITALKEHGIELVEFSPMRDKKLPEDIQGILLGGGYPELFAHELSSNITMISEIKKAVNDGLVIVAECGGYMYLCDSVTLPDGEKWPMAGVIHTDSSYKGKLVRFGYVSMSDQTGNWINADEEIKGHEFHYYDCDDNGSGMRITKASTGNAYEGYHITERMLAGYPHLYYPSCISIVDNLYEKLLAVKGSD